MDLWLHDQLIFHPCSSVESLPFYSFMTLRTEHPGSHYLKSMEKARRRYLLFISENFYVPEI